MELVGGGEKRREGGEGRRGGRREGEWRGKSKMLGMMPSNMPNT